MFVTAGMFHKKRKGRRARSSRLPILPLTGNPVSLTEGGLPVVCWPALFNPKSRKNVAKLLGGARESLRILYGFRLA